MLSGCFSISVGDGLGNGFGGFGEEQSPERSPRELSHRVVLVLLVLVLVVLVVMAGRFGGVRIFVWEEPVPVRTTTCDSGGSCARRVLAELNGAPPVLAVVVPSANREGCGVDGDAWFCRLSADGGASVLFAARNKAIRDSSDGKHGAVASAGKKSLRILKVATEHGEITPRNNHDTGVQTITTDDGAKRIPIEGVVSHIDARP